MKKGSIVTAAFLAAAVFVREVRAKEQEQDPSPQSLEQRLLILERKYEIDQEAVAAKVKEGAAVVAGKDGFQIKSNDGNFLLKFTGYIQLDYRDYLADQGQFTDQFLLRRVRPLFEGTISKVVDFRILADFANGGGTANSATTGVTGSLLQDAYVELKTFPAFKFRAGKFKGPFSLERLQSATAITFVERAFPTSLAPNRETGVQLSGDFKNGAIAYQSGVFNGGVDGGSEETDLNDGKDYIGRVFVQPFKATAGFLQGFGLGVAGSIGTQGGSAASAQLPTYRTNAQQPFFNYQQGVFADGRRSRVSPQGYWYHNSVGLFGEYTLSDQEVTSTATVTTTDSIANRGWVVAGSYVLTGENTSYRGVKPRKDFDPKNDGWGALELTGRYSELRIDNKAFPRYANIAAAARRASAWTGGFNWYLSNAVKVVANYEYTAFEGGAAVGNRRLERAILSRIQIVY